MARLTRFTVISLLALAFVPAMGHLIDVGRTNEYAGHGLFVPLFSLLIAWMDRARLRAAVGRGDARGLLLLLAGIVLVGIGYLSHSPLLEGWAVTIALAGSVAWLYGMRCLRAAAFPVGFLAMMAPLPNALVAMVTLRLQTFAAAFAAGALQLVGIPVYQVGVTIALPSMTLQVAEVCNGLRFLLALVVLTAAFAQVTQRTTPRKIVLVVSAIVLAVIANAVRVAAIGIGVQYIGPEAASGTVHHMIGKLVWAITIVPLVLLGWRLARTRTRTPVLPAIELGASKTETA
jgi:exosortase